MPAIAVRKRVYEYQTVMEPHYYFVRRMRIALNPIANVAEQHRQPLRDFSKGNPEVLLGLPVLPCPPPRLIEHFQMQLANVIVRDHFRQRNTISNGPLSSQQNVFSLPLVQLFLGGETRDQASKFIRR